MIATHLPSLASIAHNMKIDSMDTVGEAASSSAVVSRCFCPSAHVLAFTVPSFFCFRNISKASADALDGSIFSGP